MADETAAKVTSTVTGAPATVDLPQLRELGIRSTVAAGEGPRP